MGFKYRFCFTLILGYLLREKDPQNEFRQKVILGALGFQVPPQKLSSLPSAAPPRFLVDFTPILTPILVSFSCPFSRRFFSHVYPKTIYINIYRERERERERERDLHSYIYIYIYEYIYIYTYIHIHIFYSTETKKQCANHVLFL